MKTSVIVVGIIAIIALVLLINTAAGSARLGGETCQCMLVGDCVFEEGVGYRWRQCYGSCYVYSHWYRDGRCRQEPNTITGRGVGTEVLDPDIWTKHPEIVREVLQKAGFKCGVKPTILPEKGKDIERKPEWTCRFEWTGGYAEFYIPQK